MLYDINKTFYENLETGPIFTSTIPERIIAPEHSWINILGYNVMSPIGVPACAITTSKGITLLSQLGYDILTYKTIRSTPHKPHPLPNIGYINYSQPLTEADIGTHIPNSFIQTDGLANSFGNNCEPTNWVQQDIAQARASLSKGQVLIISIYGSEQKTRTAVNDFVYSAQLAHEAGAQIIEANVSCPNLNQDQKKFFSSIYNIAQATSNALPHVPLLLKLGYCSYYELEHIMLAAARGGAQGITGINTVPMQVINRDNKPYFGSSRSIAGISGEPIRSLSLQFLHNAAEINKRHQLNLTLCATGGITSSEHFEQFLEAGANVVMSATGTMINPYLAAEYHQSNINRQQKTGILHEAT